MLHQISLKKIFGLGFLLWFIQVTYGLPEQHLFNLTYGSRLIYQMRGEINSVDLEKPIGEACLISLKSLVNRPSDQRWSLKMLDANSPLPTSLLSDMRTTVQGYDQCLEIEPKLAEIGPGGQFCLLQLYLLPLKKNNSMQNNNNNNSGDQLSYLWHRINRLNQRTSLTLGLCIPSTCRADEVEFLFTRYFTKSFNGLIESKVQHCQKASHERKPFLQVLQENNVQIAVIILSTALVLVITGTIIDCLSKNSSCTLFIFFRCFSYIQNSIKLFHIVPYKEMSLVQHRLSFLYGIRTILMIWILLLHSCALIPSSAIMKVSLLARFPHQFISIFEVQDPVSNFISNGTFPVEAFFLISGFLLTSLARNTRVTLLQHVVTRYIRFALPMVGVMMLKKCLVLLGNGPFFATSLLDKTMLSGCHDSEWWKNLLLFHNWTWLPYNCLSVSWFLAAEFQIHLIAFVLLILIRKKQTRLILLFCVVMISISIVVPLSLLALGVPNYSTVRFLTSTQPLSSFPWLSWVLFYQGAHCHFASYFLGALAGILVNQFNQNESKCNKSRIQCFLSRTSLALVLVLPLIRTSDSDDPLVKGVLVGLHTGLWTLALAVQFYCLSTFPTKTIETTNNNNNVVNQGLSLHQFLSAPYFQISSRLTFSIYLIHTTFISFNLYTSRTPFELSHFNLVLFSSGIFLESIIGAHLIYSLFECPFVNLTQIVFGRVKPEEEMNKSIEQNVQESS